MGRAAAVDPWTYYFHALIRTLEGNRCVVALSVRDPSVSEGIVHGPIPVVYTRMWGAMRSEPESES